VGWDRRHSFLNEFAHPQTQFLFQSFGRTRSLTIYGLCFIGPFSTTPIMKIPAAIVFVFRNCFLLSLAKFLLSFSPTPLTEIWIRISHLFSRMHPSLTDSASVDHLTVPRLGLWLGGVCGGGGGTRAAGGAGGQVGGWGGGGGGDAWGRVGVGGGRGRGGGRSGVWGVGGVA